jgi:DoxX-like family
MIKQNWLKWLLLVIPALMLAASGAAKLSGAEPVVKSLSAYGIGPYITALGVLEFVIVGLFLWPTTRNVGFFLACSYLGGAMATHLTHGEPVTSPMVVLVLFWVALFLTNPAIFLPRQPGR